MKLHGLYCGPNWSNGKEQLSVATGQPAVDALDQLCKEHDAAYATSTDPNDLLAADREFSRKAIALGWPKSLAFGIAVGGQAMFRAIDIFLSHHKQIPNMAKTKTPQAAMPATTPKTYVRRVIPIPKEPKAQMASTAVPAAYSMVTHMRKPKSKSGKDGSVVLSHKGLVSSFVGSATFNAVNFQVNPGLAGVFPWASQLARSYDKYRFRKLKFQFRSVVPTTSQGVVMMSFDYDTLDTLPTTKFEHAQTTPNVESNVFQSSELVVACDNQFRFVRQGTISNADLKTYDFGQLVISSSYASAVMLGEIYVDYEVELTKPSHGLPVYTKIVCAGSRSAPFTNVSSQVGGAQPAAINSATTIKFVRPGEYGLWMTLIGSGIGTPNPVSLASPATAGSATAVMTSTLIDSSLAEARYNLKIRVGAGDILDFANAFNSSTTITQVVIYIAEVDYLLT